MISTKSFITTLAIFTLINSNLADIYLHNPRGSNNRHNERTRERANPNLNFDSQNNARGGYNVGDDGTMYYYAGSILPIEWTNQHSCNDVNADCTLILQYTCSDSLRDGTSTTTIPVTPQGESNSTYRLTESLPSYLYCRVRSRNKNLFIADQTLTGSSSIYTRQNPAGTQYGYECPEERDYYPYWQPTLWKDIAILTNREDLCDYYKTNSENVQGRSACTFNSVTDLITANNLGVILPNNAADCQAFNSSAYGLSQPTWVTYPSHNLPAPVCHSALYTRENHLGDSPGSEMSTFNWTVPSSSGQKCVLRIRYNISTADYDGWNTSASSNPGNLFVMTNLFSNQSTAISRGYQFVGNPNIQLFPNIDFKLQLAINTAQYGRVFQDRSFTFQIRNPPASFGNRPIYNLNVRGRRGNIVQVYPAVEYDFVPNRLEMPMNSYIHIQWIGSNSTPDGAGQGAPSTDRSNLLLLNQQVINSSWQPFNYLNYSGLLLANYPALLNQSNFLGFSLPNLRLLAASGNYTDPTLNGALAYFDLGVQFVSEQAQGVYHYVSTRNNDFSNRDQKARITVQPFNFNYQLVGQDLTTVTLDDVVITFPQQSLKDSISVKVTKYSQDQLPKMFPFNGQNLASKESLFKDVISVEPYDVYFTQNIQIQIPLSHFDDNIDSIEVLQFLPKNGVFLKLSSSVSSDGRNLSFSSDSTGVYAFVKQGKSQLWIAGVIIAAVLVLIIIISTIVYFRLSPSRYSRVKEQVNRTKRSFFSRI